jgi:hypothetical protein
MQDLSIELLLALELDEAHRRTRGSLRNGLGIALVVLLRLHIGLDVFGRHQAHFMPVLAQDAAKVMSAAARLHRHHTGCQSSRQPDDPVSTHPPPQHHATGLVQTRNAAAVLAKIDPKHRNRHRSAPLLQVTPAACYRSRRGGPSHKTSPRR